MLTAPPAHALPAAAVIESIGINTHIGSHKFGYQNLSAVEAAIRYLGARNIRDSATQASDVASWLQVSRATGAKFDDYIGETSPADMHGQLGLVADLTKQDLLNFVEGGNEEDDPYARGLGNTLQITAAFQRQVYATGHALGLPVINMSFGQGWTAANDWHGDYDKVGDLAAYADYANAHSYPNPDQTTDATTHRLNDDAHLAAQGRPVITTEIGWNDNGRAARQVVQAVLDGIEDGDVKTYFYALFNDDSGAWGLMNADGSPRPAGTALHNLTTLLAEAGRSLAPGSLQYRWSGQQPADNALLMEKSNGSYWLALWDETAAPHRVTLTLPASVAEIRVFDPVTGTTALSGARNTDTVAITLGNDPLLIEIVPSASHAARQTR